MRGKPQGRSCAGWRVGSLAEARLRTAAGVVAGCGAALALVFAPVEATAVQAAPVQVAAVQATPGSATGAPVAGTITTLAGGVGAPPLATQISFESLDGCATVNFANGHVYLGDEFGFVVRAIDPRTDALTTPAGIGQGGFDGDNVPATATELNNPCAGTVDGAGNW